MILTEKVFAPRKRTTKEGINEEDRKHWIPHPFKKKGCYRSLAFDISEPDVYLRYNKIGVYMEGPFLSKWGRKTHFPLYSGGT